MCVVVNVFFTRFECSFQGGARANQSELFEKLRSEEEHEMMGGEIQKDVIYISGIPYKVSRLYSFRVYFLLCFNALLVLSVVLGPRAPIEGVL